MQTVRAFNHNNSEALNLNACLLPLWMTSWIEYVDVTYQKQTARQLTGHTREGLNSYRLHILVPLFGAHRTNSIGTTLHYANSVNAGKTARYQHSKENQLLFWYTKIKSGRMGFHIFLDLDGLARLIQLATSKLNMGIHIVIAIGSRGELTTEARTAAAPT